MLIHIYKRNQIEKLTTEQKEIWDKYGDVGHATNTYYWKPTDTIFLDYVGQFISNAHCSPPPSLSVYNLKSRDEVKEALDILTEYDIIQKDIAELPDKEL